VSIVLMVEGEVMQKRWAPLHLGMAVPAKVRSVVWMLVSSYTKSVFVFGVDSFTIAQDFPLSPAE
jgi:hypothetical protein